MKVKSLILTNLGILTATVYMRSLPYLLFQRFDAYSALAIGVGSFLLIIAIVVLIAFRKVAREKADLSEPVEKELSMLRCADAE